MFSDLSSSVLEIDDSPKYDLKTSAVRAAGSKSPAEKTMDSNNGEKIFFNIFPADSTERVRYEKVLLLYMY